MKFSEIINQASQCVQNKNYKEAASLYQMALKFEPNNKKIYFNLGVVYLHLEEFYNAIENLRIAIKFDIDYSTAHTNIGIAYKKIKEYSKAIKHLQLALSYKNDDIDILYNLGNTFSSIEEYDEAIKCFDKVIKINPSYYKAYHGKGLVYNHLMDYENAYFYFQKTLEIKKDYADSIFAISLILLRNGDFLNGWKYYESRFEATNPLKKMVYSVPFYNGEDLKNKIILIQEEQGFGDNIQFIRYVELIKILRPKKIYVAVRKELIRIFNLIDGICVVTDNDILYDVDYVASLLSMPRIFKTTVETIPKTISLVMPPEEKDASSVIIQNTKRIKVGFSYQGNKEHKNDLYRSIPLETFKAIFNLNDIEFYSLQIGENKDLKKLSKEFPNVFDCSEAIEDFYDTAQILHNLDLIITIDSALAHFSGSLEKQTYLLLPQNSEWRWLDNIDYSPWYPSVKLFRQKELGMWREVIDEVKNMLNNSGLMKKFV